MTEARFSIITVSLNSEAGIEACIASVAKQSYPNREHIIIDGGSQDATVNIIKKYEADLSYWVSESDEGISDAFNKGIAQASGDYLLFINSDDYLIDDKALESINAAIQGRADYYLFQVMSIHPGQSRKLMPNRSFGWSTHFKMGSCHQGHVISRKMFEQYGNYDKAFKVGMDYDFVLRVHSKGTQSRSVDIAVACMGQDGVSSRKDWSGLRQRFDDERRAHQKNCPNALLRLIYFFYWPAYLTYRKIFWRLV